MGSCASGVVRVSTCIQTAGMVPVDIWSGAGAGIGWYGTTEMGMAPLLWRDDTVGFYAR